MMKKKILGILLSTVLAAGVLGGCAKSDATIEKKDNSAVNTESRDTAESDDKITIRTGVMTGIAEHFIALEGIEQGIFEKYGIDYQYTEFGTGVDAVNAITTGQIDLAEIMDFGIINRIGQTSDKSDLRIVAQNYVSKDTGSETALALYVNPETVSSIDDLKGKKISVALGTQNEYQNTILREYANLSKDDLTEVPLNSIADTIAVAKNGEIDAVWSSGQYAANLKELGWTPLVKGTDLGLFSRDLAVASEKFASDTEALKRYFQARAEIVDYILNNEDEAAEFIEGKTGISKEQFKDTINGSDLENKFDQDTYDGLKSLKDWSVSAGNFADYDLNKFINTEGLKEAYPDRVSYTE